MLTQCRCLSVCSFYLSISGQLYGHCLSRSRNSKSTCTSSVQQSSVMCCCCWLFKAICCCCSSAITVTITLSRRISMSGCYSLLTALSLSLSFLCLRLTLSCRAVAVTWLHQQHSLHFPSFYYFYCCWSTLVSGLLVHSFIRNDYHYHEQSIPCLIIHCLFFLSMGIIVNHLFFLSGVVAVEAGASTPKLKHCHSTCTLLALLHCISSSVASFSMTINSCWECFSCNSWCSLLSLPLLTCSQPWKPTGRLSLDYTAIVPGAPAATLRRHPLAWGEGASLRVHRFSPASNASHTARQFFLFFFGNAPNPTPQERVLLVAARDW